VRVGNNTLDGVPTGQDFGFTPYDRMIMKMTMANVDELLHKLGTSHSETV